MERALTRLARQLGQPLPGKAKPIPPARIDLSLPRPEAQSVEFAVKAHLHEPDAPVHYVENSLICSLFGLLCWQAIFAPVPGAFFHPFHTAPVDLFSADFHTQREELFASCMAHLDSDAYKQVIRDNYTAKFGIQSPFVFWAALDQTLLEQALDCLPAAHLRAWFKRLLVDIKANRAGMPDLIQATACKTTSAAGWPSAPSTACRWTSATCSGQTRELSGRRARAVRIYRQGRRPRLALYPIAHRPGRHDRPRHRGR